MKSVKKILAVLLATAMIFAICAISVFADSISDIDGLNTSSNNHPDTGFLYYVDDKVINAQGTLKYAPSAHSVELRVYCKNIEYNAITEYLMFAQCAVNYTDGSQDFFTVSRGELIDHGDLKYVNDSFQLSTGKIVESFDAEFFIWYENDTLWEGRIYESLE